MPIGQSDSGVELCDLLGDVEFVDRAPVSRDANRESIALRRLAKVFTEPPEIILKSLVEIVVEYCGADSSGISLEEPPQFRWIAVAGSFQKYLNGTTPRDYSPCGTCLDKRRALHYKVSKPYYDFLGVEAEPILDGLLIPWDNTSMRGTIWAVSHRSEQAFDLSDYEFLKGISDFVSMAIETKIDALRSGGMAKANELAHAVNNPLQCVVNSLYLARLGGAAAHEHVDQAAIDLKRLSDIVAELLRIDSDEIP